MPNFTNLDLLSEDQRRRIITASLSAQLEFALDTVPFWSKRLKDDPSYAEKLTTLEDFSRIPILTGRPGLAACREVSLCLGSRGSAAFPGQGRGSGPGREGLALLRWRA